MELSLLKIFYAVAETGSITGAAKQLCYVQSNVTARIHQLEEEVGVKLFIRKGRGITITPCGKVLLEHAVRILRMAEDAKKAVKDFAYQGTLSIGSMETTAAVRLPNILSRFHTEYPDVEISMTTGTSAGVVNMVLSYDVDLAFVGIKINHPEIISRAVFFEELTIVGQKRQRSLKLDNPLNVLVFRAGCSYRSILEQWLRESGKIPYRLTELGTLDGILGCVRAGMGITLLPKSTFDQPQYRHQFSLTPLPKHLGKISTYLIWRKDVLVTKTMENFTKLLEGNKIDNPGL